MKSKNATLSLLLVLLVLAVAFLKWQQESRPKEAFDRSVKELRYTRDARCRMECRRINEGEIKEIMKKGIINFSRSDRRGLPCPTFALQGRTGKGAHIRVYFLQCAEATTVVDCYNLGRDAECACPDDTTINQ